jgi:phospholipid/cholesterol/gamma-HCH transport system substrate-binding protein
LLGTFLWFARVQLDQQFAYYDIRFPTVSGLSDASDVRFGGLPVGQVVDVRISDERDGTITVRVEVDAQDAGARRQRGDDRIPRRDGRLLCICR